MNHFLGKNIPAEQSKSWIHLGGTIDWVNAQESDDKHSSKEKQQHIFNSWPKKIMLNNHPVFQHGVLAGSLVFCTPP